MFIFLTQLCGVIKILCFHLRNSQFRHFRDRIGYFEINDDFEQRLVAHRGRFFCRMSAFYCVGALTTLHTNEVMTIFSGRKRLPYRAWYPMLDWQDSARDYWIVFAYQYCAVVSVTVQVLAIETFFNLVLFALSVQLEIIGHRLRSIGMAGQKLKTCDKVNKRLQFEHRETQRLIECIQLHIDVHDFKNQIEDCLNVPYSIQAIASGIVISSILNEIAQVSRKSTRILFMVPIEFACNW